LMPLAPRYISTVDSGNLAGHLLTLKQGLLFLPEKKIIHLNFFEGFCDTLSNLIVHSREKEALIKFREGLQENYPDKINSLTEAKEYFSELELSLAGIITELDFVPDEEDDIWAQKSLEQIRKQQQYIYALAPWLLFTQIPVKFLDLVPRSALIPSLKEIALTEQILLQKIISYSAGDNNEEENEWLTKFRTAITEATRRAKEQILIIEQLAAKCVSLADIEYDFLFDRSQNLLSIGYNVEEQRRDNSYYDLLASEARLTTFVAIAQGKLPQESWFALGRQLTNLNTNSAVLLSWSGSMFEYLMPLLVMPTYGNTLLEQTYKAVVQKQIEYGKKKNIPWGISESGYNMVDAGLNYQYKAFGVPGLGFKRGLGEDLVISPYSTIMALMVIPDDAYENLQVLKGEGFEGRYGFYEAVDYTASRLQRKQKRAIIQSFMAHHQGMAFLSLSCLLLNRPMHQRFESEVHLKSTLLLLQERIPRVTTFYSPSVHEGDSSLVSGSDTSIRVINTPNTVIPEIQLLSNGRYHVMVTNAGGGYSRWNNMAVTRWREDSTCDNWGSFCYIRDLESNLFWSSAYQPTLQQGESYEAVFSQGRAEFRRRDFSLETHTEIVVSPEDDIELKRVHITNRSRKKRTIEITSYAEVVLAVPAADEAHPAFSNLFVQTYIKEHRNAILCNRRPRSADEKTPWMFHLMKVHDAEIIDVTYETDREKFIGRGNTIINPEAMRTNEPLKSGSGSVLDPVVSIQYRIILEGNKSVTVDIITGMAATHEVCCNLVDKYQEYHFFNRVLELAWTHSQVILHQINAVESDSQLYARLAGSIIFSNQVLRADPSIIIKNRKGQSGLWGYAISGDIPIVLVQIEDSSNIDLVKQMVQAHAYWRLKGLIVDLVIWNDDHGGYRQVLHNQIQGLITPVMGIELRDRSGGIFVRSAEQISNEDRVLFQSVAHIIISDKYGSLEEQMNRRSKIKTTVPYFSPTKFYPSVYNEFIPRTDLLFFNGLGGFTTDGKEYVITVTAADKTPAPMTGIVPNFLI
ncbi:MAG: glucoamylase family protein, partial [Panacibacter sp.]